MVSRLLYFSRKALDSVRGAPGISLLTSGTIAAALVVLGAYATALQNLENLALIWGRAASVSAYVDAAVPAEQWENVRARLQAFPQVRSATLVTPAAALERFRRQGPEAAALVEGVTEDVLPAAVELTLHAGFASLERVTELSAQIAAVPGIRGVDYGREEFSRLQSLLELLRYGGLIAGLLVALATAFIVSNTIRLTVYARRDEISILGLVGATPWFVRTPFLIEGALWGAAGGFLAALALWLGQRFLAPHLNTAVADILGGLQLHFFAWDVGIGIAVAGVVLGVLGSALAVSRFLDTDLQ